MRTLTLTMSSLLTLVAACMTKANPAWDQAGPWDRHATDGGSAGTGFDEATGTTSGSEGSSGGEGSDLPGSTGAPPEDATGGTPACEQHDEEDNDEESVASEGPDVSCEGVKASVVGTIGVPEDRDWFEVRPVGCGGLKRARVTLTGPPGLDLCAHYQCDDGVASKATCLAGVESTISPHGRSGCCATETLELLAECGQGVLAQTMWWVAFESTDEAVCSPYQVDVRIEPAQGGQRP